MVSQDDDNQGLVVGVLFGVIALVIVLVIGLGGYKRIRFEAPAAPREALPSGVSGAALASSDAASVIVENGVVKFYFASGQSALAAGGSQALAQVVKAVADGKKALVSGFHDATGDPAKNAELARRRALAVRDALVSLGVPPDRIELKKPEQMQGVGSNAEARRVEVAAP